MIAIVFFVLTIGATTTLEDRVCNLTRSAVWLYATADCMPAIMPASGFQDDDLLRLWPPLRSDEKADSGGNCAHAYEVSECKHFSSAY